MTDTTVIAFYRRPADETAEGFGKRLRDAAAGVAADPRASTVVLLVDDGRTGGPPEATAMPSQFDAALVAAGVPTADLPAPDAAFAVTRRVIKARDRGRDGERSEGFTVVCPSVRAPFLTHDQFDAHWRDNHSRIHVASSPGTCHYEQLIIDDVLTPDAPSWDGVGLLSFATATDYTERIFDGPEGQKAIYDDVARFLDLEAGETLPASEYVYRDDA
jgi:hypothetical protein